MLHMALLYHVGKDGFGHGGAADIAVANKQYFNHNFKIPFVSWHILAYLGISWQEPENTGFFQDVSLPGRQTPNRGKMAYLGICWHIVAYYSLQKW